GSGSSAPRTPTQRPHALGEAAGRAAPHRRTWVAPHVAERVSRGRSGRSADHCAPRAWDATRVQARWENLPGSHRAWPPSGRAGRDVRRTVAIVLAKCPVDLATGLF